MPGGNLYDFLRKQKNTLDLTMVLRIAIRISKGMEYLHQNNIVHRDLKTANLLMGSDLVSILFCIYVIINSWFIKHLTVMVSVYLKIGCEDCRLWSIKGAVSRGRHDCWNRHLQMDGAWGVSVTSSMLILPARKSLYEHFFFEKGCMHMCGVMFSRHHVYRNVSISPPLKRATGHRLRTISFTSNWSEQHYVCANTTLQQKLSSKYSSFCAHWDI
jgi:hypothetical protein